MHAMPIVLLATHICSGSPASGQSLASEYAVAGAVEGDKPAVRSVVITRIGLTADALVEWQMDIALAEGKDLAVRAVSERAPMSSVDGPGEFSSYMFRDQRGKVTLYRNARTGRALLPKSHFTSTFLPTCRKATPLLDGFATAGQYIGHIATLRRVREVTAPEAWGVDFDIALDPDMMLGILWPNKDDGTGQDGEREYRYSPFTESDYIETIEAGCNYFGAPPATARPILQDRAVFFNLPPVFPDDFYRSNYHGIDMLTDEPAIRMVFMHMTPAAATAHPSQVADFLVNRLKGMYGREGTPYRLHNAVKALTPMGSMDLRVDDVPCWETYYEAAFYELAGGAGGIVHEGRYQRETEGWEPTALLGPGLQVTPEDMLRCHYAVMRGAARAFGRHWGTSIYGQCNPTLREPALRVAYDMGAKWFWFWTMDHDHHLPQVEKLRLMRSLREYAASHPRRGIEDLRDAAKTAIALPWGYLLDWRHLWRTDTFSLERKNHYGVTYREVIAAAAWEGILCAMRGEEFDFTIDHDGLDRLGYVRIIHIREDGSVDEWPFRIPAQKPILNLHLHVGQATQADQRPIEPGAYILPCAAMHGQTLRIDGDLSDWDTRWVRLPDKPFGCQGKWNGPEDLSAKLAFGYDDKNLYLAADVTDDVQQQSYDNWRIWDGDCIQVGLDPLNTRDVDNYVPGQNEFGLALTNAGQATTWQWFGPNREPQGPIPDAQVAIRRDANEKHTYYEASIPLSRLTPLLPIPKQSVGVCVVLADSDGGDQSDGPPGVQREGFIETSGGAMTHGKHPDRFGSLEFDMPPAVADHKHRSRRARAILCYGPTVLASGKEVTWNLRTLVPPGEPLPIRLEAVLSSLTPLPPAKLTHSTTFEAAAGLELRDIPLRLVAPPGRYRFMLSVYGGEGSLITQETELLFVHAHR